MTLLDRLKGLWSLVNGEEIADLWKVIEGMDDLLVTLATRDCCQKAPEASQRTCIECHHPYWKRDPMYKVGLCCWVNDQENVPSDEANFVFVFEDQPACFKFLGQR